jgi:hypothetical protein
LVEAVFAQTCAAEQTDNIAVPIDPPDRNRKRSTETLAQALEDQLSFLERSAAAFDAGVEIEAQRLSGTLRILLHSKGSSTSVLRHLRLQETPFLDSRADHFEKPGVPYCGMVGVAMSLDGSSQRYVPLFDTYGREDHLPFGDWWGALIYDDGDGAKFSRERLVVTVADKDGGAHVDASIPEAYARMTLDNALKWNPAGLPEGTGSPALATIRQIAHEVLRTMCPRYARREAPTATGEMLLCGPSLHCLRVRVPHIRYGPNQTRNGPCGCGSGRRYKDCHGKHP